jgi:hypothetical protein
MLYGQIFEKNLLRLRRGGKSCNNSITRSLKEEIGVQSSLEKQDIIEYTKNVLKEIKTRSTI